MNRKKEKKTNASLRQAKGPRLRNILLAILSGGLLTAAWPTWGIAPAVFIGFVPLLLIEARVANGEK